jgi:hypothetical protein
MEVKDHSKEVRRKIQQRLIGGMNNANRFVTEEAADGAPVKSGNLRDNTEVVREATEVSPVAVGASKADYAHSVNRHNTPFYTAAWLRMKAGYEGFFRG